MMDINVDLFLDKKSAANTLGGGIKSKIMPNRQLAEELHKPIIGKLTKLDV